MVDVALSDDERLRLLHSLRRDEEFREDVRRELLTKELLELPQRTAEFAAAVYGHFGEVKSDIGTLKSDVAVLKSDVAVLKSDVAVLKSDVAVLKSDVAVLKVDVAVLKVDVGDLKGSDFERRVRERAASVFSRVGGGLRKVRVIDTSTLADLLDEAVDSGTITWEDRQEAMCVDAVIRAVLKSSGESVYLVAEVSVTVDQDDLVRAARRATIVGQALGHQALPIAAGRKIVEGLSTGGVQVVLVESHNRERGAA